MNNMDDILKLLQTLAALPFDHAEVTTADFTVKVSTGRAEVAPAVAPTAAPPPPQPTAAPVPQPQGAALVDVSSPIIGVYYSAPSPEDEPYVKVGDHIKAGQTLCVLEAMKLMNELPAPVSGVVREILGANGGEIEVGQVLFRIEAAEGNQ